MVPKRHTFNSTPLPPTSITMSNTSNNNMNITDTPGIGDAAFGGYKLVAVGTSEHTIQVPVALPMSKHPYRKVMVVNFFFRKIKTLATDLSFTSAELVSTIATYFNWNTSPVENKSSIAAETIPAAVLHVSNLTGLSYQNQYGAAVSFDITDARPVNLRYFTFCSNWRASDIDSRWPNDLFSVDFVLKWPQNTVTASTLLLFNIASPTIDTNTNMTVNTDPLVALLFELGNLGDDHVVNLSTDDMRALLKRSVSAIIDTPTESVKRKHDWKRTSSVARQHLLLHRWPLREHKNGQCLRFRFDEIESHIHRAARFLRRSQPVCVYDNLWREPDPSCTYSDDAE